jgi:phage shock protein A
VLADDAPGLGGFPGQQLVGVLEDVGGDTDDIQKELDEAGTAADGDNELAALKAQIGPASSPPELASG